jgi:hypothetical protein
MATQISDCASHAAGAVLNKGLAVVEASRGLLVCLEWDHVKESERPCEQARLYGASTVEVGFEYA